jgi:hypothetical protein
VATTAELSDRKVIITPVFSVQSGDCFDVNGYMTCFYGKVHIDDDTIGYIIYKANRAFANDDEPLVLYNDLGDRLSLLTPQKRGRYSNMGTTTSKRPPKLIQLLTAVYHANFIAIRVQAIFEKDHSADSVIGRACCFTSLGWLHGQVRE